MVLQQYRSLAGLKIKIMPQCRQPGSGERGSVWT